MRQFAILLDDPDRAKLDGLSERFGLPRADILRILLRSVDIERLNKTMGL